MIKSSTSPSVLLTVLSYDREGMRRCHIRDGAALVQFLAWLEELLTSGKRVTEWSAAEKSEEFRR